MNKTIQTIYEIYRSCRLCGAGAGYKMPIIHNFIQMEDEDVELKEKIENCVQIKVDQNDKMPPLICEVCVDKVNDFYDFMKMCHTTNNKTRQRLGLPLQVAPQNPPQQEQKPQKQEPQKQKPQKDTESDTVYINSDSEGEPLSKQVTVKSKPKPRSVKLKEEREARVKAEPKIRVIPKFESSRESSPEPRETRNKRSISPAVSRSVSPKRRTRNSCSDDFVFEQLQDDLNLLKLRKPPGSIKREVKKEKNTHRSERGKEDLKVKQGNKNESIEILVATKLKRLRDSLMESTPPSAKRNKTSEDIKTESTPEHKKLVCQVCNQTFKSNGALGKHMTIHTYHVETNKNSNPVTPVPKTLVCEICKMTFKNAGGLGRHLTSHGPKPAENTPEPPKTNKKPGPKSKTFDQTQSRVHPQTKSDTRTKKTEHKKDEKLTNEIELKSIKNESKINKNDSKINRIDSKTNKYDSMINRIDSKTNKYDSMIKRIDSKTNKDNSKTNKDDSKINKEDSKTNKEETKKEVIKCLVCNMVVKTYQGLTSHRKQHKPSFTPEQQACNPCEAWFLSDEEAAEHHKLHLDGTLSYTCNKCYGDFTDLMSFELHFTNNQCLSTYEIPDVKCDECWKTYPTYKLLEEHKCSGQGARPGGQCSNCKKHFTLLKNRIIHEMRCKPKTKIDSPKTEKRDDMLPMEVRLIRCDTLLKNNHGVYDVSNISHTFGLDRNHIYPYFYSQGAYNNTTDYNEENKDLEQNYSHWDSDDDDSLNNSRQIDKLSTLSIKTLFSTKCLGKVPKKLRMEKAFESIMSINFTDDIRMNIDSIINDLDKEDSDNHKKDDLDLLNDKQDLVNDTDRDINMETHESEDAVKNDKENDQEVKLDESDVQNDLSNQEISLKNDEDKVIDYNHLEDKSDSDVQNDTEMIKNDSVNNLAENNVENSLINDSHKDIQNNITDTEETAKRINESPKIDHENTKSANDNNLEHQNVISDKELSKEVQLRLHTSDLSKENSSIASENFNINVKTSEKITTNSKTKIEHLTKVTDNSEDSNNLKDMTKSDLTLNKNKLTDSENTEIEKGDPKEENNQTQKRNDTNESIEKIDYQDIDDTEKSDDPENNVKENDHTGNSDIKENKDHLEISHNLGNSCVIEKSDDPENNVKENDHTENSDVENEYRPEKSDHQENSDVIEKSDDTENDLKENSDAIEKSESNGDGISLNSSKSEFKIDFNEDTKQLIDELDAQIGENDTKNDFTKKNENLTEKDNLASLDLDAVSDDEYNFDT